jgi:hypothetical protein
VVYNWNQLNNVSVDVSSALAVGTRYEVRNAQNFYAPVVASGVYSGQPLVLPMTNLTVAAPQAALLTPPPTGPTFNVFELLPRPALQIRLVARNVQISWPTNLGPAVLEVCYSLGSNSAWYDGGYVPVVVGDRFTVTDSIRTNTLFYRLGL